ncbi:MAG: 6,7-dimethyl-8-ribityllumazine synthase [Zetaproteobacteria bacterium CG_4_9_14_3_um_filter_49_83]|nr:MAG: 6,7-dimethyl-8-ribityllumazine synthase [Zetaproteobacteria bacterium CG1_02_49_23]PIQ31884.1 MAG: 6,7-dimethyl-8-ribityllumazine synthase [Zetaproteobacteria bacterium CG17_big_fil_post_rev_8_21_14_2_50_50_13]PIV30451.1 MAG: 6,7-dimethyl-8-ribityllumazine synthase [Zetaproteobacteria bacterium CG02_land_8_20_14_3_00_50_9]PIY55417.1 MAG: 6,7-dimethyl-8-ribityllumazine synthase [Zetaproteobacteria bacterium CG_4_10_14_0_8_um_filter_49_80]PJA34568.1 MAG: 6,7-dimethyl-8-ribityllumazine syn
MSLDSPHLAGQVDATGLRIGIIRSRFNLDITQALVDGAVTALKEHGSTDENLTLIDVPGAFEIGTIASCMADSGRFDAIVCLGCVIRGDTAHFDYVCQGAMHAIGKIANRGDIGVGNGVLTVDTHQQAQERIGGSHGHKGEEAALTAVEIACTLKSLKVSFDA